MADLGQKVPDPSRSVDREALQAGVEVVQLALGRSSTEDRRGLLQRHQGLGWGDWGRGLTGAAPGGVQRPVTVQGAGIEHHKP